MSEAAEEGEYHSGQVLLGKLEIIRRIGGGGMGVVYEVEHRLTGHRRALKVVRPCYADRPRFMKRLLREAKVAGTLDTEHVVETYDAGRLEDGSAYVVMQLLQGCTLYDTMEARGAIEPRRLANIMVQVAEGMAVAHGAGIIHRDLKPENIYLVIDDDGEERVKILDFGVSKFELNEAPASRLTAEGTLVGTPYYMSPEQAGGRPVDARSDVYAMGVMIYEALVGKLPFEAGTIGELFVRIGAGECVPLAIRRPDLDPAWHEVVHRAFHRDAAQRYQSAEALRRELLLLASGTAAKRARTISDGGSGARETQDYDDVPLPPPPRLPAETIGEEEIPLVAETAPSPDETAPSPDETGRAIAAPGPPRPLPRWTWGALGAAAVLILTAAWQLGRNETSTDRAPPAAEVAEPNPRAEEPAPPPEPSEPPREEVADVAPDAGPAAPAAEPSPARNPNRARPNGLDPNPYR